MARAQRAARVACCSADSLPDKTPIAHPLASSSKGRSWAAATRSTGEAPIIGAMGAVAVGASAAGLAAGAGRFGGVPGRPTMMTHPTRRSLSLIPDFGSALRRMGPSSSSPINASCSATSLPLAGRRSGLRDIMRDTTLSNASGTLSPRSRSRGVSSSKILARTAVTLGPSKGRLPCKHSNKTQPSENTSARASTSRAERACSGAIYSGVPTI